MVRVAEEVADTLLFPAALETDAASLVPLRNLDALAEAGMYGAAGPKEYGGAGLDLSSLCAVVEALSGGCLTTAFVWIQHNTPVRTLAASPNEALKQEWLPDMCAGRKRTGIAFGGLRAGPSQVIATQVEGGWRLDGDVPLVSGWGRIDALLVNGRTADDSRVVSALVPAVADGSFAVEPLRLLAANASGTVRARLRGVFVPLGRVVNVEPYHPPPPYDGGGRSTGSPALGVARRCLRLIGPSALDAELVAARQALDDATDQTMAAARAAACELALRSAGALIVAQGSSSLLPSSHAQRLLREAVFLQVFASRPAIREALLQLLGAGL
ncbi:MAG TPA: acyl-CoA dehydrogenase family protein [Dehalococcoidia bacterium]|nr:acyl-CoA dehydrogenase family protein [Dehalococcoidia bacterium]